MRLLLFCLLIGTGFASEVLKDANGREYRTVKIGETLWMAENLDVDRFRDGDVILHAQDTEAWVKACNDGVPAWCHYPVEGTGRTAPGKLYNEHVVKDPRGIAPKGWRIPKPYDFVALAKNVEDNAALRSKAGWEQGGNGTNASGFNAIPGGYRFEDEFFGLNLLVNWWTLKVNTNSAGLHSSYKFIDRGDWDGAVGFYIRCIKE